MRLQVAVVLLLVAVIGLPCVATFAKDEVTPNPTEPETTRNYDEIDLRTIKAAGLSVEPAELCEFIKRLIPNATDEALITQLVRQLGDPSYDTRQNASEKLISLGPKTLVTLRAALTVPDAEAVHRAEHCIRQIERDTRPNVVAAAVRTLGRSNHSDSVAALLEAIVSVDESGVEDWHLSLAQLGRLGGVSTNTLVTSLKDAHVLRRIAAAKALLTAQQQNATANVRPLLQDSSELVRLRVGIAFAEIGERAGVVTVISTLPSLSNDLLIEADDFLTSLAGESAPAIEPGDTQAKLRAYQVGWQDWWSTHGAKVELSNVTAAARANTILIAASVPKSLGGTVFELTFANKSPLPAEIPDRKFNVRRRIDDLAVPVAVHALPRGRILVAEHRGGKVTERDFKGTVLWEKSIASPVSCQRAPNGGVFMAGRNEILEVNRDGSPRYRLRVDDVSAACRRRDGSIAVVTNVGACQTLDENGVVLSRFPIGQCLQIASVQALPQGRLLIPDYADNRVIEYDATGRKMWSAEFRRPNSAYRLPNGRTLVASQIDGRAAELDSTGKVLREIRLGDAIRPWHIIPAR